MRPDPPELFSKIPRLGLEEFVDSSEPARLSECLALYYLLLRQDKSNKVRRVHNTYDVGSCFGWNVDWNKGHLEDTGDGEVPTVSTEGSVGGVVERHV